MGFRPNQAVLPVMQFCPEPLVDINRGRLWGWALIGAIALLGMAALSDPSAPLTAVLLAGGGATGAGAFWTRFVLRDAEWERQRPTEGQEPVEAGTGEPDGDRVHDADTPDGARTPGGG